MSDFVTHKGHQYSDGFSRSYESDPIRIHFDPMNATKVRLANGKLGEGTCVGCHNPPCMLKAESELLLSGALSDFPGDPNLDVCPSQAMAWDTLNEVIEINSSQCIGCGLCVARCPYGAIRLETNGIAAVQTADPNNLLSQEQVGLEARTVATPFRSGFISTLDSESARNLPGSIERISDGRPALFIRNLLHEIGLNARVRRRGDTNIRMDAVGTAQTGRPFVAEIEFADALETPRALLEDVAVLHARYGYSVSAIDPISIVMTVPNVRSEYYQVMRDIYQILGLQCRTITVGVLVAVLWTDRRLPVFGDDTFSVGSDSFDLTRGLRASSYFAIEPYSGAFRPPK